MIDEMLNNKDKKLGDFFIIDDYKKSESIFNTELNKRAKNILARLGCFSIGDALNLTVGKLLDVRSLGKLTFENIVSYFSSISDKPEKKVDNPSKIEDNIKSSTAYNILCDHKQQIIDGNFDFLENESDAFLISIVRQYKISYELLGGELTHQCGGNATYMRSICAMLADFSDNVKVADDVINSIPDFRKEKSARNYIDNFTSTVKKRHFSFPDSEDEETLNKYINRTIYNCNSQEYKFFLIWCSYDLFQEINHMKELFNGPEREWDILTHRAHGETLEQVGNFFGVTRERIRQIEIKGKSRIVAWENSKKFLELCAADKDDPSLISKDDLAIYGEAGDVIFYSLKDDDRISFTYNKSYHVYLLGIDRSLDDEIAYVESLPEVFNEDEYDRYFETGLLLEGVSKEQLKIVFNEEYSLTGKLYHRCRLSLGKICETIVRKYYPKGIRVHNESEVQHFKKYVYQEFGDIGGTWTLRSLEANVERVCILCGRGIYMAKKDRYISDELKRDMEEYIDGSDNNIFFINTIYEHFKSRLKKEGVDNHYFLHGIMKEIFADKYYINRDYLSKEKDAGNIREEIVKFVAKSKYPLKMDEIKKAFPGVTDIILSLSLNDHDILNFFGSYIHYSNLNLYQYDKIFLKEEIDEMIADGMPHHAKELFERVSSKDPGLLGRLGIKYEFALFSVVQRLFEGEYQFSRPYIAESGIEIMRPEEEIKEFVSGEEVVETEELLNKCEEFHYRLATNKLTFFMGFNDSHLLINKNELKSIESIGITEQIARRIELLVYEEIKETIPIAHLKCVVNFPKVNVPWTEQLVYSVLYKWADLVEVNSSFNMTYENAVLLVAPKGKMNNNIFEKSGDLVQADDLDNIDELIEDDLIDDIKF